MQEVHADKVLMLAIGNNDYISYNRVMYMVCNTYTSRK